MPTSETTPVWANTVPVAPAEDSDEAAAMTDEEEALPALPMQKGDPDWSKPETSANGDAAETGPQWAQTLPTSPGAEAPEAGAAEEVEVAEPPVEEPTLQGTADSTPPLKAEVTVEPQVAPASESETEAGAGSENEPPAEAPVTAPPRAVAADALKSTWPPAAESAPAPPEETDIWPPEPPTEKAMLAWPPPSELEEPATPAQAIPSWPESMHRASTQPSAPVPAAAAPTPPTITPPPQPEAVAPTAAAPPPGPPAQPASRPPAPAPAPAPTPPSQAVQPSQPGPVSPAQSGPPPRPMWAPTAAAEPATHAPNAGSAPPVQVPAWAPRVPLAAEPGTPTWFSPREAIPHTTAQPVPQPAPAPKPTPQAPIVGGQLPVAPVPATLPTTPAQPAPARSTWEVVEQKSKSGPHPKVDPGPTAEDRSYAEWFAWAKRGGAPASACHAAAQGAFKALSSGKDVSTAVQWATAAMSRPPENVSFTRQTYCARFSLANIDLNLDQHRAHAFATAAVHVLDAGQDAAAAHAAGLVAAGIR